MSQYVENYLRIKNQLKEAAAGREIELLPVTKMRSAQQINQLAQGGVRDIGENRVQEYLQKKPFFNVKLRLHMIGQLQSNKVRGIIEDVVLIHSVDRAGLAKEIQRQAERIERQVDILLQVNIAKEQQKAGAYQEELAPLIELILQCSHLKLRGIMTMAPLYKDPELARPVFAQARRLFDDLRGEIPGMDILSMGMSGDCMVAAQEGSTMARVGTALFAECPAGAPDQQQLERRPDYGEGH